MATFREGDFMQLYKDVFFKPTNVEELVKLFLSARTRFNPSLLDQLKVVTRAEWRDIEENSKGGVSEKREKRARNLIQKVIQKNCLEAYRGFRAYVEDEALRSDMMDIVMKVFPFGVDEDRAGLAPKLGVDRVKPPSEALRQSNTPTILWVASTKAEFDVIKRSLGLSSDKPSSRNGFHCEEIRIPVSSGGSYEGPKEHATLFLAHPETDLDSPSPFRQLLPAFNPRPHLAVLTGQCQPIAESNIIINQSDIVVATCKAPLSIEGEVQYLTELWKLKGELKKVFPNQMPSILFGRATNAIGQDRLEYLVHSPRAVQFYSVAREVEGMEYLAVLQIDQDTDKLASRAHYVYKIVQRIASEL